MDLSAFFEPNKRRKTILNSRNDFRQSKFNSVMCKIYPAFGTAPERHGPVPKSPESGQNGHSFRIHAPSANQEEHGARKNQVFFTHPGASHHSGCTSPL